jgi:hypothetical protein
LDSNLLSLDSSGVLNLFGLSRVLEGVAKREVVMLKLLAGQLVARYLPMAAVLVAVKLLVE